MAGSISKVVSTHVRQVPMSIALLTVVKTHNKLVQMSAGMINSLSSQHQTQFLPSL